MSNLSQFFGGGGGVPIGGSILALDAPNPFLAGSSEYLRTGTIKTYDASYAASIAAAPQLRVFGNDAKTSILITGGTVYEAHYQKLGSNYWVVASGSGNVNYGASVTSLNTAVVVAGADPAVPPANNGSHAVISVGASAGVYWTSDGITFNYCAGFSTVLTSSPFICYGNNSWIAVGSLTGYSADLYYINNASPSGTWTQKAANNVGLTTVRGIAYGNGVFVAVGNSASATAGKIATTDTVNGTWTDRTASSGITFLAADGVEDVVFDGTNFIAIWCDLYFKGVITSPDGINWTYRASIDTSGNSPLSGATTWTSGLSAELAATWSLTTDGAGTTTLQGGKLPAPRAIFAVSTDHGATWVTSQIYVGKSIPEATVVRTMSYVGGNWVWAHAGKANANINIGASLATPDYIGQQTALGAGQYVRIK